MAQSIQIEVLLDDKGVVQGTQRVEKSIGQMGARGNAVFQGMGRDINKAREAQMPFA